MDFSLKKLFRKSAQKPNQPGTLSRDCAVAALTLVGCTLLGLMFYLLGLSEANTITIYILGILMISAVTRRTLIWACSAIIGILLFNWFYADPHFTFNYFDPQYAITTIIMMFAALLIGGMSEQFRRRVEEKAELSVKAESERLRANLLRSVGHDLRTPLTGISGDAEILLSHGATMSEDMRRKLYESILDNSEWLINMVENLLFITRLENNRPELRMETELLSELVEEAVQHVNRRRMQHRIETDLSPEMILVSCDSCLLMQAITNIVDNAVKHTPYGSTIAISTRMKNGNAVISIADNGPGLGENRERAFDTFFSTAGALPADRRGMGLGLPLCKTILAMHNGRIDYRDNKPHGAVFELILPAERIEPA